MWIEVWVTNTMWSPNTVGQPRYLFAGYRWVD
jgi:hypothetical protein